MPKRKIIKMLKPVIEFIEFRVLHIDDSPERIAGGVFAGILIAYTPLLGLHFLVALLVSMIFRVNKFATLSFIWVSNVVTLIPIYYPSYILGRKILNLINPQPAMTREELLDCFKVIFNQLSLNSLIEPAFWQSFWYLFTRIGLELFVGGLILGTIVASLAYKLTVRSITRHRRKIELQHDKTGKKDSLSATNADNNG